MMTIKSEINGFIVIICCDMMHRVMLKEFSGKTLFKSMLRECTRRRPDAQDSESDRPLLPAIIVCALTINNVVMMIM